ncbi:hypothetical protein ElyMa_004304500 [Elysia marginata]|uniref:Uncharacterized protein n=1 Tax=Elysia marginata TaxID=1093978 RepID=A0AAV4GZX5_9GAST|nr:hypothetical protein ElyMa_004304500 [Elysia marginata]
MAHNNFTILSSACVQFVFYSQPPPPTPLPQRNEKQALTLKESMKALKKKKRTDVSRDTSQRGAKYPQSLFCGIRRSLIYSSEDLNLLYTRSFWNSFPASSLLLDLRARRTDLNSAVNEERSMQC